jgi:hypothetical protein
MTKRIFQTARLRIKHLGNSPKKNINALKAVSCTQCGWTRLVARVGRMRKKYILVGKNPEGRNDLGDVRVDRE